MIADGTIGNNRLRVGIIAFVGSGASLVNLLISKPADFDALGGIELVSTILTSLKPRDAAAQPAPPAAPPSPAPASPGGPAAVAGGKPDVPALARPLTFADLAGEWTNDDSVFSNYVNSRGGYAGYQSIATREKWIFDGKGGVSSAFTGITSGSGATSKLNETKSGTVTFSQGTVITLVWRGASTASYVIRGWGEIPGATVLLLNGPWYSGVPADVLADRRIGVNLNSYWLRKKP